MSVNKFFQLVQIKAKLASFISFFLGTAYAIYRYRSFNLSNFIIMFISVMAFAMATTAINNYIDDKKEKNNQMKNNFIEKYGINETKVLFIIFIFLTIATIAGIVLTLRTNIVVLFFRNHFFCDRNILHIWPYSNFKDAAWRNICWFF